VIDSARRVGHDNGFPVLHCLLKSSFASRAMPERMEKLRSTLHELEQQLQSIESLDEETRKLLQDSVDDLHRQLDRQPKEPLEPQRLIDRLRATEERFQVSHPTLSGMVLRVIDALGQLGI
jgi:hypothetical protein